MTADGDGCSWTEADGNLVALPLAPGARAVSFELWREAAAFGLGGDERVGVATLQPAALLAPAQAGQLRWLTLGNFGQLQCCVQFIPGAGAGAGAGVGADAGSAGAQGGGGAGGGGGAVLTVRVQRARNLKDTEFFGKQDPYVLCYLLPEQEGADARGRVR